METIIKFEEGKTYATTSICDSAMVISVTIVKRTAKRVTFSQRGEKEKTVGINIWEGVEQISPYGKYSFSPTIRADDVVEDKAEVKPAVIEDKILFENGETLADLFREGAELFSQEQMDAIKMGLAEVLFNEAITPVKPMAKVYNMADYRR